MAVSTVDIVGWASAFIFCFVLVALLVHWRRGSLTAAYGVLMASFFVLVCGGLPFPDALDRYQYQLAKRDFTSAHYIFYWVNQSQAEMPVGNCVMTLDVHKVNGIYRPTIPLVKGVEQGGKNYAVLSPAWQKHMSCPA